MNKQYPLHWVWIFFMTFPLFADPMAPELLDMLNEDPSLLLDPGTKIAEPPASLEPAESERVPASSEEVSKPEPKVESKQVEPDPVKNGAPPSSELEKRVELEATAVAVSAPKPPPEALPVASEPKEKTVESEPPSSAIEVSFPLASNAVVEVSAQPVVAPPPVQKLRSELEAVPGVGDYAIILDGNQFFPAAIKMKPGSRGRLLFITTGQKPAALVFTRPKIQRWLSSTDSSNPEKPVEEFREFSAEKIAQIPFEAERGVYEFYDALSGAKGEIRVE